MTTYYRGLGGIGRGAPVRLASSTTPGGLISTVSSHGAGNFSAGCGNQSRNIGSGNQNYELPRTPVQQTASRQTVLMVAEKPSVARAIADNFPNKTTLVKERQVPPTPKKTRKGPRPYIVLEFGAKFKNVIYCFKIVSTMGHVRSYDFSGPKYMNRRKSGGMGELFGADVCKGAYSSEEQRMKTFLENEFVGCCAVILWLDGDKAGECISVEVLDVLGLDVEDPRVFRARFFGLTGIDVEKAMNNLDKINMPDVLSIDCLQFADLRIGVQFSRFLTQHMEEHCGGRIKESIAFGPCQTPALAFIVKRFKKYKKGKSDRYYNLVCTTKMPGSNGKIVKFKSVKRFNTSKEAANEKEILVTMLGPFPSRQIKVIEEMKCEKKPPPLKTYELMRMASKKLQLLPDECMVAAEELYVKGKISYPRTNEVAYPTSYIKTSYMKDALMTLRKDKELRQKVDYLLPLIDSALDDPKLVATEGTLPPIMPLMPVEPSKKNVGSPVYGPKTEAETETENFELQCQKLFDLVFNAFVASLSEDCDYIAKTASFSIGNIKFEAKENVIHKEGFMQFMPDDEKPIKEEQIGVKDGQQFTIVGDITVEMTEQIITPMTVAELITEMEDHHIGTNGSTATHIARLMYLGYIEPTEEQYLVPTKRGIDLINVFRKCAPLLIKPELRREMEDAMNRIKNETEFPLVLKEWVSKYKTEFESFLAKLVKYEEQLDGAAAIEVTVMPAKAKVKEPKP